MGRVERFAPAVLIEIQPVRRGVEGLDVLEIKTPRTILRASRPTRLALSAVAPRVPYIGWVSILAVISPARWGLAVFRLALRSVLPSLANWLPDKPSEPGYAVLNWRRVGQRPNLSQSAYPVWLTYRQHQTRASLPIARGFPTSA